MNESIKKFLQQNAYQLIAAAFTVMLTLFAAYVSLQLFEQSTTFKIEALQRDVSDVKANYVTRDEFKLQQRQLSSMDHKIDILLEK